VVTIESGLRLIDCDAYSRRSRVRVGYESHARAHARIEPATMRGPDHSLRCTDGDLGPMGFDPEDLSDASTWKQVGDGSFGKVYAAELLGEPVAVKVTANARPDRIAGLKRDLWYLNAFAHPNVTRVYGAFIENGDCHMVMEFVPHSLRSKRVVNEVNRVKVLADVARALTRIHACGHVHRDVKARNVLISEDYGTAKLTDFGLARALPGADGTSGREEVNPRLTPKIGPPKYRAPEVENGTVYDTSSDIFGYGVMCFQLVEQLRRKTRKSNASEVEFIRELGRLATEVNPSKRPTARQCLVMCMSWLKGGDDIITPDVYPGRNTVRQKYWVTAPMDGGTWKQQQEPSKSPSDSDSGDDEPLSPRSISDARAMATNGDVPSIEAQRGRKRDEMDGSDTPVSAPPMNAAKRVNSTSTDLHVRGELDDMRITAANHVKQATQL
jgi:serine/threonine-protein kinase 24/25/MST4